MSDGFRRRLSTVRSGFGIDLAAVALVVAGAVAAVTYPWIRETPVRVPFAFVLVLFLPGYALVAAAFPERYDPDGESARPTAGGIGPVERVVLSVAVSIAVVIITGVVLVFSVGFALPAVLFSLSGITLGATVLAAARRGRLRPEHRYSGALGRTGGVPGLPTDSPADAALSIVLVLSVVTVGGVIVADAVAPAPTPSPDLFLLAPNGTGPPTADNYPTDLTRGESQPMVVGVTNHAGTPANYTVVVVLQRIDAENGTVGTTSQTRLDTFGLRVGANETIHERRAVVPTVEGSHLRLAFLLYREQPPPRPTVGNADQEVHIFVNVTA